MKKVIIIVALILTLGVTAHAAAMPLPTLPLPYVPPTEVGLYDTLFNAYGVTAINESDETKKLAAYVDLFQRVLGVNSTVFFDSMENVLQEAKQTRQITITQSLGQQLSAGIKSATTTGVYLGGVRFTVPQLAQYISQNWSDRYTLNASDSYLIDFCTTWVNNPTFKAVHIRDGNTDSYYIGLPATRSGDNYGFTIYARYARWSSGSIFNGVQSYGSMQWFGLSTGWAYYGSLQDIESGEPQLLQAKDSATQASINAGTNTILTADSELTQSNTVDATKPIVINIYRTISYPATTSEEVEEKQRELVVTNIATDEVATTEKAALEDVRAEIYGEAESYRLDLISFFPFCIPRDIMLLLQAFSAEPVTPEINIPFPTWENGEMSTIYYNLSLSDFDNLAGALRAFEDVAFMIGLLVVTRQKYLRG